MARAAASVLQLHVDDGWHPRSAAHLPCRWTRRSGVRVEHGASPLAELPDATETILVVPVSRVTLVQARLPRVRGAALHKAVAFAVEEAVVAAPEDVHAVLLARARDGDALIAVMERAWLDALLDALAARGLALVRVIAEHAFVPATDGTWTVVHATAGGFLVTGGAEAVPLDAAGEDPIPVGLRLALHEARRDGRAPEALRVRTAPGTTTPDAAQWTRSLRVPVSLDGAWAPEQQDARVLDAPDLRPATRTARRGGSERSLLARCAPAVVLAAVALVVHAAFTVHDYLRLATETQALRAAMERDFRSAFPDLKMVDPGAQMPRLHAALRRDAGAAGADDALPLLSAVAPTLAASGTRLHALRYEAGRLELELPAGAPQPVLAAAATAAPVRIESLRDPRGTTVVRVLAEAPR
jgi:type II secretion system protein L